MRRLLSLWAELFRLSFRRMPWLSLTAVLALAGRVVAVAGSALALRAAVDSATRSLVTAAVVGAAAAAVAYALTVVVQDVADSMILTVADRVGRLDLHPEIHRDLATLEGIEHLERTEFLDRITLVRKAGGRLAVGAWNALKAVASVAGLVVTLLLLGSVNPWLLLLLGFAALPIWADHRGQVAVQRADLATAETFRLQQHYFDLGVNAASGKELRVAGAGAEIVRRQRRAWDEAMRPRTRAALAASAWSLLGWTVFVAAFIGGLALAAARAAGGDGTPGDLVLLVTVAATLRSSIQSTVDSTVLTAWSRQYVGPYLWLRDYAAAARSAAHGTTQPPGALTDGIALDTVSYAYPGTDRLALDSISVRFPAGAVVAIVGEYGSGKSTLVKLLSAFYRPDSGRITVDGTDLADLDIAAWRARSTAAFQDFGRFHSTVAENVGLGDLPHLADEERIRQAIADADATDLVAHLPQGLHTQLGRHLGGVELSEGQWQRSALARASMRTDPLLFILDEPTASLDAPSERAIFERHMARARHLATRTGAITVIVSHRFSTVTGADLIVVLDRGRLTESGTHDELLAAGGTYAELYAIQADAYRLPQPRVS